MFWLFPGGKFLQNILQYWGKQKSKNSTPFMYFLRQRFAPRINDWHGTGGSIPRQPVDYPKEFMISE
jgi:hypothetical protein